MFFIININLQLKRILAIPNELRILYFADII